MQCKLCHNGCETFYEKRIKSDFHYCKECQFFFKDEALHVDEKEEYRLYSQHNNSLENSGYVAMFEDFLNKTLLQCEGVVEVLDFGSGPTPVLAHLMRQRGYSVEIYDKFFSPQKVYEERVYDAITSTEVIEHIKEPLEVMRFFHAHLKKGGYLCLMSNFHQNSIEAFCSWWYCLDRTHISFFNPHTFEVLGEKVGFKVLYADEKKNLLLQRL